MKEIKKIGYFLFALVIFTISNLFGNEIIFNKNGVIVTNNDLVNYKKLYNDYYGKEINNNTALKNLYITIKIIDIQSKQNPIFDFETDKIISEDINKYKDIYSKDIMSYFLKYQILKNDFIGFYLNNNNIKELDNLVLGLINVYKDINCRTIKEIIKFKKFNNSQKKIILSQLSKDVILIDDNTYVCLSNSNINEINNLINGIITGKGNKKFLDYVYKNIK